MKTKKPAQQSKNIFGSDKNVDIKRLESQAKEEEVAKRRRRALEVQLKYSPHTGLEYNDTTKLPAIVREAGYRAMDLLETQVMVALAEDGENDGKLNCMLLDRWLKVMNLTEFKELLLEKGDIYDNSIQRFVKEVVSCLRLNPILLALGAEFLAWPLEDQIAEFPPNCPQRNADIRRAVIWCFLLQAVTIAVIDEEKPTVSGSADKTFFEKMLLAFEDKRNKVDWESYFNLFERMKFPSVQLAINDLLSIKRGEFDTTPKPGSGALLSINILEACYQDLKQGYYDNAECGYELLMEPSERSPIKGLGNDLNREFDPRTGLMSYKPPFPDVWANLYSSWNLCFVRTYLDWPVVMGKLVNPATAGMYQRVESGLYLHPRIIGLYMTIHKAMFTRAERKSRIPEGLDWRSDSLSLLWGKINAEAARAFQGRVDKTVDDNYGPRKEFAYDMKRVGVGMAWKVFKNLIDLTRDVDEREEVEEFQHVKAQLHGRN